MKNIVKKFNKKGFTLIELLAVIVVLAVLMLVAGTNVFSLLGTARRGSFKTEFLTLIQSAQTTAQLDMLNGKLSSKNPTKCYDIADLNEFDNKGGYTGSVKVEYKTGGKLTITGWMSSDNFLIEGKTESLTDDDVKDSNGATASTTCGS